MSGVVWGPLGVNLATAAGALPALMTAGRGYGPLRAWHRAAADRWVSAFAFAAAISLLLSAGNAEVTQRLFLTTLTVVGGLRLAIRVSLRRRDASEDPSPRREGLLRSRSGRSWSAVLRFYLPQVLLAWSVCLPVQFPQYLTGGGGTLVPIVAATLGCALSQRLKDGSQRRLHFVSQSLELAVQERSGQPE